MLLCVDGYVATVPRYSPAAPSRDVVFVFFVVRREDLDWTGPFIPNISGRIINPAEKVK
jgi:hypothetical protein